MNEYVGELIDDEECKRRLKQQHDDDVNDFYMLTLDRGRCVLLRAVNVWPVYIV